MARMAAIPGAMPHLFQVVIIVSILHIIVTIVAITATAIAVVASVIIIDDSVILVLAMGAT